MIDVFQKHQTKIAFDTLKLSKTGALVMGGMDHKAAVKFLYKPESETELRALLKAYCHSSHDIEEWINYAKGDTK